MSAATVLRLPRPFDVLPWPLRIDWRRGLAQGAVFGVLPLVVDFPVPTMLSTFGTLTALLILGQQLLLGAGHGFVLACTAQWLEGRWGWPALAALFVLETAALITLANGIRALSVVGNPLHAGFAMLFWLNLAYGSVFFAHCLATQRSLRVRSVLARAELEREHSATALNEARIDAMAARVDPALLLRVLTAAREAYGHRRDDADALLDALVDFLRLAMPAVRSGKSTLLAELSLLRAHAALRARLEPGSPVCMVTADGPPRDIAFPPLLLIPLVEAVAAQGRSAPRMRLSTQASQLLLTLDATTSPGWMDETTAQRLERALRSLYPSPEVRFQVGASPSLTVWLPLPPTPEEVAHATATIA